MWKNNLAVVVLKGIFEKYSYTLAELSKHPLKNPIIRLVVCIISSEELLDPRLRRSCRGSRPLEQVKINDTNQWNEVEPNI